MNGGPNRRDFAPLWTGPVVERDQENLAVFAIPCV